MRSYGPCLLPAVLAVSFALFGALSPADAADLRVLRSDESVLEILWSMDEPPLESVLTSAGAARRPVIPGGAFTAEPGEPDLPAILRLVGLPSSDVPRLEVVNVATAELPLADLAAAPRLLPREDEDGRSRLTEVRDPRASGVGVSPAAWAEFRGVSRVRSDRVARLAIQPCRWDASRGVLVWARSLQLRIRFDASSRPRDVGPPPREHPDWDSAMGSMLLNAETSRTWRSAPAPARRGTADSFDSSMNWVRVPIRETGIYRLDYFTFANLGVDPAGVDPRTVRVFAGTNLPLEESLLTPPPTFMTECALKDLGNGDDVFELDDRFLFWAHGPTGWANEFDPARPRTEHVENEYIDESFYWLTWEAVLGGGSFGASPRRMSTRSVVDSTFTGGIFPSSTPHRLHFEENNADNFSYKGEDGWMWEDLRGRGKNRTYPLDVPYPASGDGTILARMYSHQASGRPVRRVELKLRGVVTTSWEWIHSAFAAQFDVTGCFNSLLVNGRNAFQVNADHDDDTSIDHVYTSWFDVEYDRQLVADGGRYLHFFTDPDSLSLPTAPSASVLPCTSLPDSMVYGRTAFHMTGFDAPPADIHLFDVSDQHVPVDLVDFSILNASAPYDVEFSDPGLTATRWYVACTMAGVRTLPQGEFAQFRGLRDPTNQATYLVLYHEEFEDGAVKLAEERSLSGEYIGMAIDVEDIYQEFGWGMRDPVAVRDFLRQAQSWQLSPLYVALVGDAAFDTKRNLSGSPTDWVSTYTRRYRETSAQYVAEEHVDFYSTDDFFGYLDADDYTLGSSAALDIAIGRFPVANRDEMNTMVGKIISYLADESPGQWQNRVILVADDERVPQEAIREKFHTQQVETLSRERLPAAIDRVKIYLVDFPRNDFDKKPEAQEEYIEEYTRGALMTTYTGHGDQNTMAQEEVFVSQKISELLNEKRYTIFSTFSCQISRFDLLSGDSMTELMLKIPEGGAVTTFASGGLVFPTQSATLNQEWLGSMYGTPYITETFTRRVRPIGLAALAAKVVVGTGIGNRKNNEKYVLLGDPALAVRFGETLVDFEPVAVDSQLVEDNLRVIRGQLRNDDGEVLDGTLGTVPFSGNAWVHVTEDADTSGYDFTTAFGVPDHIDFTLDGNTVFRGEVPVVDGRFEVRFYLNEAVFAGNRGRISVFALEDGGEGRDASGAYDDLVLAPTLSPDAVEDDAGPRLVIRFEGYEQFTSGDLVFTDRPVLKVGVEDPSGINLRPFPQFARLEGEIDGEDRIDLTDDFSFFQSSFTQGEVRRPLLLPPGTHSIRVKAFDNVGNRGEAEARFTIVLPEADFRLMKQVVTTYPNPFRDRVDVVFQLTHDAEVSLKVFTVTGRKVYEAPLFFAVGGTNTISWDGRDDRGTPLANGTYLYKLEARRTEGSEEGPSRDEHVGRMVRMR